MQPLHRHVASHTLPDIPHLLRPEPTAEYQIKDTHTSTTNDTAILLPTPKPSVTAQGLLTLLDKINAEMKDEIYRVAAAISEVEDSVKLLRFDRMKAACIRSATYFAEDEGRNNLQIL